MTPETNAPLRRMLDPATVVTPGTCLGCAAPLQPFNMAVSPWTVAPVCLPCAALLVRQLATSPPA